MTHGGGRTSSGAGERCTTPPAPAEVLHTLLSTLLYLTKGSGRNRQEDKQYLGGKRLQPTTWHRLVPVQDSGRKQKPNRRKPTSPGSGAQWGKLAASCGHV